MRCISILLLVIFLLLSLSFGGTVKITFWYALGGTPGEVFKGLVEEFNKAHPDIKVEAIYTGGYADTAYKVTAALAGGTLPNGGLIAAGPIFTGAKGNYKILDYIMKDKEFDKADFYTVCWEYAKYNGKICAIPYNISVPLLYYNKKLMAEAGLNPNKPPKSWNELLNYAKRITRDINGDSIPDIWGVNTNDTPWIFKAFLLQNNNRIIDNKTLDPLFDKSSGIEVAEFWKKLVDEKAMPVGMNNLAIKQFEGSTLGFFMGSSARLASWVGKLGFDFGVTSLPVYKKHAIPIGGAVLVLFPKEKSQDDATWEFIKWLTTPQNIAKFSIATGYLPIRKSALKLPEVKEFLNKNPHYQTAFKELQYGMAYWHFEQMGTMDDLLRQALEKIERGIMLPSEAMKWAADELRKEIKSSK